MAVELMALNLNKFHHKWYETHQEPTVLCFKRKENNLIVNLFKLQNTQAAQSETFTTLLKQKNIHIEHIRSNMPKAGEWYIQEHDEWILLLQGEAIIEYEDSSKTTLIHGDTLYINALKKHRVYSTSPDTLWLAIHLL